MRRLRRVVHICWPRRTTALSLSVLRPAGSVPRARRRVVEREAHQGLRPTGQWCASETAGVAAVGVRRSLWVLERLLCRALRPDAMWSWTAALCLLVLTVVAKRCLAVVRPTSEESDSY